MPAFPQLLPRRPSLVLSEAAAACAALMDDALAIAGLTSREYSVLALLEAAEGPMAQVTIGFRLQRDRSTIGRTIVALARKGFVDHRRDLEDGRVDVVAMTRKGAQALSSAHAQLDAAELEFFGHLSAAEQRQLLGLLDRLF